MVIGQLGVGSHYNRRTGIESDKQQPDTRHGLKKAKEQRSNSPTNFSSFFTMVSPNKNTPVISDGARTLQERLHKLLSRLAETIEQVKKWPEAKGDDASIHVERTTQLIANIRAVLKSLSRVEACLKDDAALRESLQQCKIPLDLLDLLASSNLNPECFSRGLLREALGQLAGLKRRKLALELLGAAVQSGIQKRQQAQTQVQTVVQAEVQTGVKREREEEEEEETEEPPAKKIAAPETI
jgi:hypothetical protein